MTTYRDVETGAEYQAPDLDTLAQQLAGPTGTWQEFGTEVTMRGPRPARPTYQIVGPDGSDSPFRVAVAHVQEIEPTAVYTVLIEAAVLNTPITLADRETLTEREVVGYRAADWQPLAAAENVTGDSAREVAEDTADHQTIADGGVWRVRVWEGADADTGVEPAAEVYSERPAMRDSDDDFGTLTDYQTGEAIRPATADEHARSLAAGETGAYEDKDGRAVFVAGGPES